MMTRSRLIESGVATLAAQLFEERHRNPVRCPLEAVIAAYEALDLIDKPWPATAAEANRQVRQVQRTIRLDA